MERSRARASSPPTVTRASGSAMDTLRDKQPPRGALGTGDAPWKTWCVRRRRADSGAARQGARHRPHRLQGQLAVRSGSSRWAPTCPASRSGRPSRPSLFELARRRRGMDEHRRRHPRPRARSRERVAAQRPEVVIHMAAQPLVRRSFVDPVGTYATNVMGTVNVLDAVRQTATRARRRQRHHATSVYENREWEWGYREDEPMGGHDPTAAARAARSWSPRATASRSSDPDSHVAVATARAGNVIGGGDWGEDRLDPRHHARRARRRAELRSATRTRSGRGSTCSTRSAATSARRALWDSTELADGWNFGPAERRRAAGRLDRRAARRAVAGEPCAGSTTTARTRTRRVPAARLLEGARAARLARRAGTRRGARRASSTGTRRCRRATDMRAAHARADRGASR